MLFIAKPYIGDTGGWCDTSKDLEVGQRLVIGMEKKYSAFSPILTHGTNTNLIYLPHNFFDII